MTFKDYFEIDDYVTVKELAKLQNAFSEASLRYHIFHEKTNGLGQYIKRVGRKVLISQQGFKQWIGFFSFDVAGCQHGKADTVIHRANIGGLLFIF